MKQKDALELAQLIVRGDYINFDSEAPFIETSGIYRFTNEDITSYFEHLKNKEKVLTVIGSGGQVLNGILAGNKFIDCFDISIFPEYYLYLQLASILSLTKEEYLKYYFSDDREELFGDDIYEKISTNLKGKYKEFWDTLYMFDDGIDIYNSLLFRTDTFYKHFVINNNPYLQDNNYEKLKHILQTQPLKINTFVADIMKTKFIDKYDLVNLSNILPYYLGKEELKQTINFLKTNFKLNKNGEIINYFFNIDSKTELKFLDLLDGEGHIEDINDKKLLVYKKR